MEIQACLFLDGPKKGERIRLPLPLRPRIYICTTTSEPALFGDPPDVPGGRPPIEEIEYRLHEFFDDSHRDLVYISELDDDEAWWAYCRQYAQEHPDRLAFLLNLATDAGMGLRVRGNQLETGVIDGPVEIGWTPEHKFVAEFLGRYEILLLGFFEIVGLREK